MVVTLGQQYNIGEKPTVILYTYINRHAGTPDKNSKNKKVVVITYCYIGCEDTATALYLNGFTMLITLGQHYNVGEKPTVILYTYINRQAEPPNITKHRKTVPSNHNVVNTYDLG